MKNTLLAKKITCTRQKLEDAWLLERRDAALRISRRMDRLVCCHAHVMLGRIRRGTLRARRRAPSPHLAA